MHNVRVSGEEEKKAADTNLCTVLADTIVAETVINYTKPSHFVYLIKHP